MTLSNGDCYGCDFVLCAIGVEPNTDYLKGEVEMDDIGGIVVNEFFQSVDDESIYAIGDCCSAAMSEYPLWFQMRLWSQARVMGSYVSHCIMNL